MNNSIRHISLTDKLVLSFKGNIFRRAIALADVDNDQDNELIVGSLEGNLAIFKGVADKPWKVATGLGSISCIAVGDLGNSGRKLIVVISSEGMCNIYDICEQQQLQKEKDVEKDINHHHHSHSQSETHDNQHNQSDTPTNQHTTSVHHHQLLNSNNIILDENYSGVIDANSSTTVAENNEQHIDNITNNDNEDNIPTSSLNSPPIDSPDIVNNNNNNEQQNIENSSTSSSPPVQNNNNNNNNNNTNNNSNNNNNEDNLLIPILTQRLPPNASSILIGDIDDDGNNELVIGTYDHTLFSFSLLKDYKSGGGGNNSNNQDTDNCGNSSSTSGLNSSHNIQNHQQTDQSNSDNLDSNNNGGGGNKLTLNIKSKWQLPGQIGSLVLAKELGENILIVGLCEGTNYIILNKKGILYKEGNNENGNGGVGNGGVGGNYFSSSFHFGSGSGSSLHMNDPTQLIPSSMESTQSYLTNTTINEGGASLNSNNNQQQQQLPQSNSNRKKRTEIITNISCPIKMDETNNGGNNTDKDSSLVSIATLDGVLRLQRIGKGIVWRMEIEEMGSGQLISLQTIRFQKQPQQQSQQPQLLPNDYIITCGWDGLTLIIDPKQRNVISYKFGDRVCAFTSGSYSLTKGTSKNCFIYVSFFGEIIIYHDISVNIQPIQSLTYTTKQQWNELSNQLSSNSNDIPLDQIDTYNLLLSQDFSCSNLKDYLNSLQK